MFKTILIIHAILSIAGGACCVLIPGRLLSTYGINLSSMGLVIYQFWGMSLIGLGLLTWFQREIKDSVWKKAIALSLFLVHAGNTIIAVRGQYAGANNSGWSNVGLFAILALGFGYLRFAELRTRQS